MKYYLISSDKRYTDSPQLINWVNKIRVENISMEKAYLIPKRNLISISPNKNITFTDVISKPFLLISDKFKKMVELYEPKAFFKQVALLDSENEMVELYHIPILPRVDCLHESSEFNMDKSILKKAVLNYDKIKNYSIFQIDKIDSIYTVVRLDLLESLLRRGARGIIVEQVEIYKEGI